MKVNANIKKGISLNIAEMFTKKPPTTLKAAAAQLKFNAARHLSKVLGSNILGALSCGNQWI